MKSKPLDDLKKRIMKVNSIIKHLDPAIKLPVFEMLKSYIDSATIEIGTPTIGGNGKGSNGNVRDIQAVRAFYSKHQPEKPADRAKILAAWIYKNRGADAYSLEEIKQLFDDVGEGRPARLEMTFRAAQRDGKKLFQPAGYGKYRPNVNGENYFKDLFKGKIEKAE